jgi:uncharacterized protein (TIGR02598 family)
MKESKTGQTVRRLGAEEGFNLIEVMLAVAVVALALITVLGLLPIGIDASRKVSDDSIITTLASDMLHWRRVTPYDKPSWFPYNAPPLSGSRPATVTMYFDAMGNLANTEYQKTNLYYSGDYFKFTYTVLDHPDPALSNSMDIARVLITVEWPVINQTTKALAPNPNRRVFIGQYSRMQ